MRLDYSEDDDFPNQGELWRANLERSLRGKKGKKLLQELRTALLALPAPRLIEDDLANGTDVCAVGALLFQRRLAKGEDVFTVLDDLQRRGEGMESLEAAQQSGVPYLLAFAIVEANDQPHWYGGNKRESPEDRFARVMRWVDEQLGCNTALVEGEK